LSPTVNFVPHQRVNFAIWVSSRASWLGIRALTPRTLYWVIICRFSLTVNFVPYQRANFGIWVRIRACRWECHLKSNNPSLTRWGKNTFILSCQSDKLLERNVAPQPLRASSGLPSTNSKKKQYQSQSALFVVARPDSINTLTIQKCGLDLLFSFRSAKLPP